MTKKVCMIVPATDVMGGIASVVNGYRSSCLNKDYQITYVESYTNGSKITKLLKAVRAYFRYLYVVLFHKPDIVHIHSSFGPSFYRKLPFIYISKWFQIPIINHIHGADFDSFYFHASDKKKKQIKKAYDKCTRLIALSDEWLERLSQIVSREKIVVLENYSVLQKESTRKECQNRILFMSAMEERKGCLDIPSVFDKVLEEVPESCLVMAGDGEPETVEKIKKIFGDQIDKKVFFPGWVMKDEKDKYLRESDIFFLPSYNEGMPMAILDAMGYGLPIISTDVGGIPKLVHEGENGFLCKPGDATGFADRIIYYLKNEQARLEAGKNSRKIIDENYTLDSHLQKLERIYEEVIANADNSKTNR